MRNSKDYPWVSFEEKAIDGNGTLPAQAVTAFHIMRYRLHVCRQHVDNFVASTYNFGCQLSNRFPYRFLWC